MTYYGSYNDALIEKDSITNLSAFEIDGLSEGGIVTIWVRVDDQLINSCNGIKDLIQLQVLPDTSFEIDPNILNPLNPTENELVICNTVSETIQLLLNSAVNLSNLEFEWTFLMDLPILLLYLKIMLVMRVYMQSLLTMF